MTAVYVRLGLCALFLFVLAACNSSPDQGAAQHDPIPLETIPENDVMRGLVFDNLRLGTEGGPCEGLLELDVPGAQKVCTHGPDPAPLGLDVRVASLKSLDSLTAATAAVPCIGDGTSGNRVQAIYAVASDQPDRFSEVAPLISGWAGAIDNLVNASANQVGAERHVRFVTDANCNLSVLRAVVSPSAAADFTTMMYEMSGQMGYNNPKRKYLVWMDAGVYCGIAQVKPDDKPTSDNANNGLYPMFARVDRGCWDLTYSTALHELVHTLGGVQTSAPHGTSRFHCTDDYDNLCYSDGSGMPMTFPCASGNEAYLDCNHDDYFHPNPLAGSYLATHWNVANSSFLQGGTAPQPNQAPIVNAGLDQTITLPNSVSLLGQATDDGLPTSTLTHQWSKISGPGTVSFSSPASLSTTATFSVSGSYVLKLSSSDSAATGYDTLSVTVNVPVNQAPVVNAGADASVKVATALQLSGSATDDSLPQGSLLSSTWTKTSGPGTVTFSNPSSLTPTATFSAAGTYVLTLSANDGALSSSDTVTVTVTSASTTTTTTFSSSLTKRNPSRSFALTVGSGALTATSTFSSKLVNPQLTLELFDNTGKSVARVTGPSGTKLTSTTAAGNYTLVVTGSYVSFSLSVTHQTP